MFKYVPILGNFDLIDSFLLNRLLQMNFLFLSYHDLRGVNQIYH